MSDIKCPFCQQKLEQGFTKAEGCPKCREIATQMLMPKSYQWKAVAEKMYEIAKQPEQKDIK